MLKAFKKGSYLPQYVFPNSKSGPTLQSILEPSLSTNLATFIKATNAFQTIFQVITQSTVNGLSYIHEFNAHSWGFHILHHVFTLNHGKMPFSFINYHHASLTPFKCIKPKFLNFLKCNFV